MPVRVACGDIGYDLSIRGTGGPPVRWFAIYIYMLFGACGKVGVGFDTMPWVVFSAVALSTGVTSLLPLYYPSIYSPPLAPSPLGFRLASGALREGDLTK